MVQLQLECISADEGSYRFFRVDDAAADQIYAFLVEFWSKRPGQDDAAIKQRIEEYRGTFSAPGTENFQAKIKELHETKPPGRPFSMIDLGGASGGICYFIKEQFPDEDLRFFLIEPFVPFVEDFKQHHPEQQALAADGEEFCALDDAVFKDAPYTIFFASLVFCMVKPSVAAAMIRKAATLTDNIVLWDNMRNTHGELDPEKPVIFDFFPGGQQWYFAHTFEKYLADVGFEIASIERTETSPLENKGWATLHARRRG